MELIIILMIVLVLFGGNKISGLGKSLGTAIRDFQEAMKGEVEKKDTPPAEKLDKPQDHQG
jgi:sec-independent protein translocase protein TatA